jgi:hypothetical protein
VVEPQRIACFGFASANLAAQELQKARCRGQAMFAVLLTLHYRGKDSVDLAPGKITLEFVKPLSRCADRAGSR